MSFTDSTVGLHGKSAVAVEREWDEATGWFRPASFQDHFDSTTTSGYRTSAEASQVHSSRSVHRSGTHQDLLEEVRAKPADTYRPASAPSPARHEEVGLEPFIGEVPRIRSATQSSFALCTLQEVCVEHAEECNGVSPLSTEWDERCNIAGELYRSANPPVRHGKQQDFPIVDVCAKPLDAYGHVSPLSTESNEITDLESLKENLINATLQVSRDASPASTTAATSIEDNASQHMLVGGVCVESIGNCGLGLPLSTDPAGETHLSANQFIPHGIQEDVRLAEVCARPLGAHEISSLEPHTKKVANATMRATRNESPISTATNSHDFLYQSDYSEAPVTPELPEGNIKDSMPFPDAPRSQGLACLLTKWPLNDSFLGIDKVVPPRDEKQFPGYTSSGYVQVIHKLCGEFCQKSIEYAEQLLRNMIWKIENGMRDSFPDYGTFYRIIHSYSALGLPCHTSRVLILMFEQFQKGIKAVRPTRRCFSELLEAWRISKAPFAPQRCDQILVIMESLSVRGVLDCKPDTSCVTVLIHCLIESDRPQETRDVETVFRRLKWEFRAGNHLMRPNRLLYAAVLRSYKQERLFSKAESLLFEMVEDFNEGVALESPTTAMFNIVIGMILQQNQPWSAVRAEEIAIWFRTISKLGFVGDCEPDECTYLQLLTSLVQSGRYANIRAIFCVLCWMQGIETDDGTISLDQLKHEYSSKIQESIRCKNLPRAAMLLNQQLSASTLVSFALAPSNEVCERVVNVCLQHPSTVHHSKHLIGRIRFLHSSGLLPSIAPGFATVSLNSCSSYPTAEWKLKQAHEDTGNTGQASAGKSFLS